MIPAVVVRSAEAVRVEWSDLGRDVPPAAWSITGAVVDVFEAIEVERLRALEAAGGSVLIMFRYGRKVYAGQAAIDSAGVFSIEVARGVTPIAAAGWSFRSCGPAEVVA